MKHITFLCLLLFVSLYGLNAQVQSHEVIGAAGEVSSGSTMTLDWTLGEIATSTINYQNGMLTEGFHQPILNVEEVEIEALPKVFQSPISEVTEVTELTFNAYPNPVATNLRIEINAQQEEPAFLLLTDLNGKALSLQRTMLKDTSLDMDMSPYAAGSYYLLLKDENGNILKATKILKIR